jgi:biopolymer transport protein ExbB
VSLSGYSYYRTLTIDHTKCGGSDSSSFPVLISGTYTWFKTVGNSGHVQSSSGYDIVFSTDQSTVLNFERVSWSASTGVVEFYVNVATVSHSSNTVLYVYYGNAAITTDQQNASSTWNSNYKNVYHFQESTGTTNADSTSNAITATKQSAGHPASVAGQIGNAVSFNGTTDYETATAMTTGDKTVECWLNMSTWAYDGGGVAQRIVFCNIDGTNSYQVSQINNSGANGNFNNFLWQVSDSANTYLICGNSNLSTSTWYYVVGVFTASSHTAVLYVNATSTSGGGASTYGIASSGSTFFGKRQDSTGFFSGTMDEVRISNAVRSADWITTTYNNQNSPSTFYTVGSEQNNGGVVHLRISDGYGGVFT